MNKSGSVSYTHLAQHFSEFMTPVYIHNLAVFVTVKIPEAGIDSLIEQCQIYMIPVDLYGHNPDLSARLICRILFTKPVHYSLYRLLQGSVLPLFRETAKNGHNPVYPYHRHKRNFSMSLLSAP